MLKRRLKEPFGKAGLTVAVIALVFAMIGGAWAAVGLNSKQKKEVTKIAKKYAGKQGPQGPQGLPGANGTNGKDGAAGAPGADGKGVTVATVAAGANCPAGGASFEKEGSGTKAYACNGTFSTESLPSGQTLTGAWSVSGQNGEHLATISFPIAVSPAPTTLIQLGTFGVKAKAGTIELFPSNSATEQEREEAWEEACPGSYAAPAAASGFLCMYTGETKGAGTGISLSSTSYEEAHEFGVSEPFNLSDASGESLYFKGSWAVTG